MKEKDAPVELVVEVLRRLDKAGVLQDMILIGSWCVHFYKDHFDGAALSAIRTRDMDFLIPTPPKIKGETHILDILKGLDFVPDFHGDGSVSLGHPELIIDFLVAERGRGSDKPYLVKALGIKAQPLRYLSLLSDDTIKVRSRGLELVLPHPINYAFQKLIISLRRQISRFDSRRAQWTAWGFFTSGGRFLDEKPLHRGPRSWSELFVAFR